MIRAVFLTCLLALPVQAETANYGRIDLTGLARDNSWPFNPPDLNFVMVCNVNGPDGFLSVRSGPGTEHKIKRKLSRLAILTVDTTNRRGNWVRVVDAHRSHTKDGVPQEYKSLHVSGWAHDGYLCGFLDF